MTEREEGRNSISEDSKLQEFDWDTIKQHNSEESCWIVLYGRVYDVTKFEIDHPGGPEVLKDVAGTDASDEFENILHTEKARKMAKKWLIGKVKGEELGDLFEASDKGGNYIGDENNSNQDGASTMNTIVTLGFLALAAALAYQFYLK